MAPWQLVDNGFGAVREGKFNLQLAGPGDPTGRGAGYSFIRDVRHKVRAAPVCVRGGLMGGGRGARSGGQAAPAGLALARHPPHTLPPTPIHPPPPPPPHTHTQPVQTPGDELTRRMAKERAGKVQGTDADLRRMTTQQAKQKLRWGGMWVGAFLPACVRGAPSPLAPRNPIDAHLAQGLWAD